MKINLEGVGHLLCMEEKEFKLDERLGKVRVVQYTEQWELKNLTEGKRKWKMEEIIYYVALV